MLNSIHTARATHYIYESHKSTLKNKNNLMCLIRRLDNDIADGSWVKKAYADMDIEMMPSMIARANKKYPGLHLCFLNNPRDIGDVIEKMIAQGKNSFRCITNMGEDGIHCAVIDGRVINNKISLILFDSSSEAYSSSNLLGFRLTLALNRHPLPEYFFVMFAMDIQRSISECGIFSLTLAKKIHRESEIIGKIHKNNISGRFRGVSGFIPYRETDKFLPPSLFKYVQSITRLNKYIDANPEFKISAFNKKGESIIERFFKNLVSVDNKKMSVSLHKKRVSEYRALINN